MMITSGKPRTITDKFILLISLFYIFLKRKSPPELGRNCSFNMFAEVGPHGIKGRLWQLWGCTTWVLIEVVQLTDNLQPQSFRIFLSFWKDVPFQKAWANKWQWLVYYGLAISDWHRTHLTDNLSTRPPHWNDPVRSRLQSDILPAQYVILHSFLKCQVCILVGRISLPSSLSFF